MRLRKILLRILAGTVVLFATVTVVEVLILLTRGATHEVLQPLTRRADVPAWYEQAQRLARCRYVRYCGWRDVLVTELNSADQLPMVRTQLAIQLDEHAIEVRYELWMDRTSRLFEIITIYQGRFDLNELVAHILDTVIVNEEPINFVEASSSIAEDQSDGHIVLYGKRSMSLTNTALLRLHPPKSGNLPPVSMYGLHFTTKGVRFRPDGGNLSYVVSQSDEMTQLRLPPEPRKQPFYFLFEPRTEPRNNAQSISERRLADVVPRLLGVGSLSLPYFAVLSSLPFLLVLYWFSGPAPGGPGARAPLIDRIARRVSPPGHHLIGRYVPIVAIFLIFHFGYYVAVTLQQLTHAYPGISPEGLALKLLGDRARPSIGGGLGDPGYVFVVAALAAVGWPSLVRAWEMRELRLADVPGRHPGGGCLVLMAFAWPAAIVATGVGVVLAVLARGPQSAERFSGPAELDATAILLTVMLLVALSLLLSWVAFGRASAVGRALQCAGFVLLLVLLYDLRMDTAQSTDDLMPVLSAVLTMVVVLVTAPWLMLAFVRLVYPVARRRFLAQDWGTWARWRRAAFMVAVIIPALPTTERDVSRWFAVWNLASALDGVFLLTLLWVLVQTLRRASYERPWPDLPPIARTAGILLAIAFFFSPARSAFWIPIPFVLGTVLLAWWLLPATPALPLRELSSRLQGQFKTLAEQLITANQTEQGLKDARKELLGQLAKGEIDRAKFDAAAREADLVVAAERRKLMIGQHTLKDVILALGPTASPWENGKIAAIYATIIALPWNIFYLRNALGEPSFSTYPLLTELRSTLVPVLTWTIYGLFFGYFYPYIRGNNGIEKGWWFFLVLAVPSLAGTAIASPLDTAAWVGFVTWAMQLLVLALLLGVLAGDYETLRRAGFRLRHLGDVYNVPTLSVWASSVAVALGATITTLITTGFENVATELVRYLSLRPPPTPLP